MSDKRNPEGLDEEMQIARKVMDDRWVALRALALGDQHPELDVDTRIKMAQKEVAARGKSTDGQA